MTKFLFAVCLGISTCLTCSCGNDVVTTVDNAEKSRIKDSSAQSTADTALAAKYNAITALDSTTKYSYQYQIQLKNEPVALEAHVIDLVRTDTGYMLKLTGFIRLNGKEGEVGRRFASAFRADNDLFRRLDKELASGEFKKGYFICYITKVYDYIPEVNTGITDPEDGHTYVIEQLAKIKLYLQGDLIDFKLY